MKCIRIRDLVYHLSNEYLNGEMTIGECIDACHVYEVDETKICRACTTPDNCENCPIGEEE